MHVHIDRVFTTVARNLGLKDFSRYTNNFIEWAYEAEKLIGSRDTFVQKEATYNATGAKATGTITFTSLPVSGDSITLNGVKLYFRNSTDLGQAKSSNEIQIGQNFVTTLDSATAQYGLIQSLKGGIGSGGTTGTYANSAIYNYPEALNVSDYSISTSTGDDIITNGAFTGITQAQNITGTEWKTGVGWTIGSGAASHASGTAGYLQQLGLTFVEGETYSITFDISSWTAGAFVLGNHLPDTTGTNDDNLTLTIGASNGDTVTKYWKQGPTNLNKLSLWGSNSFDGTIDNIVVKKVNSGTLTITSKEIGNKGNEYTLASDNANAKVSALSLIGGKDIFRNQQLTLPENNVKLLGVRVGTASTKNKHYELRRASGPHRERIGRDDNETRQRAFRYYVNGNRLNIQHDEVDEITISYLAYPVDLRGWPKIKEGHETAVAQYIMWQMKLIEFYNGKLPQYITKELEKRWYYLCGKARGDDGMPTSDELKQIGNMWNTLLPIKSSNGLINL
jgi:hypothetical protein